LERLLRLDFQLLELVEFAEEFLRKQSEVNPQIGPPFRVGTITASGFTRLERDHEPPENGTRWQVVESFIVSVSDEEVKREREKARGLRKTRWWKQKLARGTCYYCGQRFSPDELTMDHVVPLIRGGKSTKSNLAAACKECNNKKKHMLPMEWEEYLSGFTISDEDER
jgi:hypothetical protein